MDAINGDSFERNVCKNQMREAADFIDEQQRKIGNLAASVEELLDAMRRYSMDVEDGAPYSHRLMIERAEKALKEAGNG